MLATNYSDTYPTWDLQMHSGKCQSLTGATSDSTTGLLTITSAQYANLQTLTLNIGGTSYGLIPNARIWPRSLIAAVGLNSSAIYLVVNNIGYPYGSGIDFCNGYGFLYLVLFVVKGSLLSYVRCIHSQRFYSIFDTANQRTGFAETIDTNSNSN